MTGDQWCKQNLTRAPGRVPFENRLSTEVVDELFKEIEEIKEISTQVVENVLKLSGTMVYLRVQGNQYLKVRPGGKVEAIRQTLEDSTNIERTAFRLECYSKVYNCIKVSFYHEETGCYMFSRSTFSCFRDLRMKKPYWCRGSSGMRWEYSSLGNLKSMNQHRRYVGVRDDGIMIDVSMRGDACRFEFVPCESIEGEYEPPDINRVTRSFDHQKSIDQCESQSMKEFNQSLKIAARNAQNAENQRHIASV